MPGGRPRKLKLTSIQRDILWEPEEAGGHSFATVVSTAAPRPSRTGSGPRRIQDALDGLHALLRLGIMAVLWEHPHRPATYTPLESDELEQVFDLHTAFYWDEAEGCWRWRYKQDDDRIVTVVLTDAGWRTLER